MCKEGGFGAGKKLSLASLDGVRAENVGREDDREPPSCSKWLMTYW